MKTIKNTELIYWIISLIYMLSYLLICYIFDNEKFRLGYVTALIVTALYILAMQVVHKIKSQRNMENRENPELLKNE